MSGGVLFVSYTGAAWGSDRLLADFASALEPPVSVACPPGPLAKRLHAAGVDHLPLAPRPMDMRLSLRHRLTTPLRIGDFARETRAAVRRRRPAVVIGWNSRGLAAAGAAARDARLVFHQNELLRGPLIARGVRWWARRADLVIALSHTIAADLGLPAEIAPGGVDPARFPHRWPRPGHREALFLGALVPWKRPELALEAVAIAARELPELRLRVAGEPIGGDIRLLHALRLRAAEPDLAGRVEFSGRLDDPREALARAHCLLHCADREPYGMALVESLAAGLPVVAPAAGGPTEIVDASCGRLYPPGDAQLAARSLVEVLRDPEPLGTAGRAKAERDHSLAASQRRYRELIDPLR